MHSPRTLLNTKFNLLYRSLVGKKGIDATKKPNFVPGTGLKDLLERVYSSVTVYTLRTINQNYLWMKEIGAVKVFYCTMFSYDNANYTL